jgi:hypothetical protein
MHTSVVYARGCRYSVPGTRKSGDSNTSSGNTKNTGEAIGSFFKYHGLKSNVRMAVLGDDNFAVISRVAWLQVFGTMARGVSELKKWVAALGYVLKVAVTSDILKAEFLSSRFYPVAGGHRIGKKPGRILSKIGFQLVAQGRISQEYAKLFHGTLRSYLPTANHVPFLRRYIWRLLKSFKKYSPSYSPEAKFRMKGLVAQADESTWAAFEAAYGLTEADEARFDRALSAHIREYGPTSVMPSDLVDRLFAVDFGTL